MEFHVVKKSLALLIASNICQDGSMYLNVGIKIGEVREEIESRSKLSFLWVAFIPPEAGALSLYACFIQAPRANL